MNSSRRFTLAWLLCLSLAAWQAAYAQAPPPPPTAPVTMQQAVEQTLAHNPALLAAQQNLLSMKGQEVEAGLRANPDFAFTGTDITLPASNPAVLIPTVSAFAAVRAGAEAALASG